MPIGFVGTGAITAAIVTGLSTEGGPRPAIRLSPRNAARASDLASRFDNVSVCVSNQEVLNSSETVILAVRPQVAEEVLSGLKFPPGQTVISVVAGFPTRRLASLGVPDHQVWRAIPLPSIAQRRSPIAVFPPGGPTTELFAPLGHVFEIHLEDHLNALSTGTWRVCSLALPTPAWRHPSEASRTSRRPTPRPGDSMHRCCVISRIAACSKHSTKRSTPSIEGRPDNPLEWLASWFSDGLSI